MIGRIILNSEIPAVFIAISSRRSPKLPNVIREASSIANGNAMVADESDEYKKNLAIISIGMPLPIISSIRNHINCITMINRQIKNVTVSNAINCLKIYWSNFLNIEMIMPAVFPHSDVLPQTDQAIKASATSLVFSCPSNTSTILRANSLVQPGPLPVTTLWETTTLLSTKFAPSKFTSKLG